MDSPDQPPASAIKEAAAILHFLAEHHRGELRGVPLLTESGVKLMRKMLKAITVLRPQWDAKTRRLWWGEMLVREFRQPAPNQTALLDAFEKAGWPREPLTTPLEPLPSETPAALGLRLRETLLNLNRALRDAPFRFSGGTRTGAGWLVVG